MASRRLPLAWVLAATVIALIAGVVVAALFTHTVGGDERQSEANTSEVSLNPIGEIPASVDDVLLVGIDGDDDRRLGELLGDEPIILNFFASWCVPCIDEMPDFERVHQDLADHVTFLGLAMQDTEEQAMAMVDRTGVTYPTYADPNGDALTFFEGTAMPTTVFLAPDGEILDVHSRKLSESELRDKIDAYVDPATSTR